MNKPMTQYETDIRATLSAKSDAELNRLAREVGVKGAAKMERGARVEAIVAAYCPC